MSHSRLVSAIVIAMVAGLSLGSQDSGALGKRVAALEAWKRSAETRLSALESTATPKGRAASPRPKQDSEKILLVDVTNKRFDPTRTGSDPSAWKLEDNIWWDAHYTATGLGRAARSIKGVLKFCDLFGDPIFQVKVTIDEPIEPGQRVTTSGVGIEYNQFKDDHGWLRTTDLEDMTFRYQVTHILYVDGTRETFDR